MPYEPKVGELPALTMSDVVWRLERVAGNTDTDPRWKAAEAIRALEGWESFLVHPADAPDDAAEREAWKYEARWISVDERLPNVGETVVILDRGVIGIGRKANDDDDSLMWLDIESVDRDGDYNDTYDVTHWMPLPAPPAALQAEQPESP